MKLSIVIPAYNESKNIEKALSQVHNYLEKLKYPYEVIVVEDGSKDDTLQILKKLLPSYPHTKLFVNDTNSGKGYSIRRGILEATGDYILFLDADMATPINEIDKMLRHTKDYDLLLGSRRIEGSKILHYQPPLRLIAGKMFALLVSTLVINGVADTQCGFKMYRSDVAKKIAKLQTMDRWAFDVEHLFLASKFKYKYKEIPVMWKDDKDSALKLFPDAIIMLRDILKIRINNILGRYK